MEEVVNKANIMFDMISYTYLDESIVAKLCISMIRPLLVYIIIIIIMAGMADV